MIKVVLSRLKEKDVPKMLAWGKHTDLRLDHYNFPYLSEAECGYWYRSKVRFLRKKIYKIETSDGIMVGFITIKKIKWFKRQAEMGIVFDPNKLGLGYGSQGMTLIFEEFFEKMHMKRLWLRVAEFNKRAISSYEKVGFSRLYVKYEAYEDQCLRKEIHETYVDMDFVEDRLFSNYVYMEYTKEMYVNSR